MKKRLFVLMAAVAAVTMGIRAEVATLKHGDELTVYYTTDALKNALADAVAGDVINLSSGLFNCSTINKAVTIIGAGMETDEDNGITATNITSSVSIEQFDSEASLRLEGLCFKDQVSFPYRSGNQVYGLTVERCKFVRGISSYSQCPLYHSNFANCIILYKTYSQSFYGTNSFLNCYIEQVYYGGVNSFVNCIVKLNSRANEYEKSAFMNSIIIETYDNSYYLQSVDNCIATTNSSYPVSGASNYTNEQIFKTFRGTYTDGEMFELTDEGKAILGNDGTEVGMQGGFVPYDPRPNNIQIERFTADKQTDANGKLNVSIKLREKQEQTE